jgi:hypothetical protein
LLEGSGKGSDRVGRMTLHMEQEGRVGEVELEGRTRPTEGKEAHVRGGDVRRPRRPSEGLERDDRGILEKTSRQKETMDVSETRRVEAKRKIFFVVTTWSFTGSKCMSSSVKQWCMN